MEQIAPAATVLLKTPVCSVLKPGSHVHVYWDLSIHVIQLNTTAPLLYPSTNLSWLKAGVALFPVRSTSLPLWKRKSLLCFTFIQENLKCLLFKATLSTNQKPKAGQTLEKQWHQLRNLEKLKNATKSDKSDKTCVCLSVPGKIHNIAAQGKTFQCPYATERRNKDLFQLMQKSPKMLKTFEFLTDSSPFIVFP